MIADDPSKRSFACDIPSQAISFACLDYNRPPTAETPPDFPNINCPNGLRAQVYFLSCWDGVNLDSPDHASHMAYPTDAYNGGTCPPTHAKHMISLFYEVLWSVDEFKNMWYGDSQPFVFALGDPTGYGGHGGFFCGWDANLLHPAVDGCTNDSGHVSCV